MLLQLNDLGVHYGHVLALDGVSLEVKKGTIVVLIGPNGAGKSTVLRTVSGLTRPSYGQIWFAEERIDGMRPQSIVRLGIAHVPEGRRVFPSMTVHENLRMGAYSRRDREAVGWDLVRVFDIFPRLKERAKQQAGSLSGGEQQMLAIGRALMSRAFLLLMDEPSLGLSPLMVRAIADIIVRINRDGTSVLLVEQNARMALSLAHYSYVLETGRIMLQGNGQQLQSDERVRKAYFGGSGNQKRSRG